MAYINIPTRKNTAGLQKDIAQKYVYNTTRWKNLRMIKLRNNPICEECLKDDRVSPAVEIHHITPFMTGSNIEHIKWLGFDYSNLMALCADCHKKIHK